MLFDYETLKVIWWLLVGVLLIGFAIMDGHDMGVCSLLPFVGKDDEERRVVVNSIGPHWEGNQVWFITGGGAIFAAWPLVYATAFSGFYWALIAVLWALFFRPVGFKYRSMLHNPKWRSAWDWALFGGSFVPAVVFGVAFGNLFLGVPFSFNDNMVSTYTGSFWALLNPFALLCGLVSAGMLIMQGAAYLALRTDEDVYKRSVKFGVIVAILTAVLFAIGGICLQFIDGYAIKSVVDTQAPANPLSKEVVREAGAWMANYSKYPVAWAFPLLGVLAPLATAVLLRAGRTVLAFLASSLSIVSIIMTAGVSLFPFVMPSSSHPISSLTVWDSVSSHMTLMTMLYAVVIFLPFVLAYTTWAYKVMSGKVTKAYIREQEHSLY